MPRLANSILLLTLLATVCHNVSAENPQVVDSAEAKYLTFQLMTGIYGYAGPRPQPGHFALSKTQLEEFVHDVVKTIGTTGDSGHKLGFTVGPLCFDMPDEETPHFTVQHARRFPVRNVQAASRISRGQLDDWATVGGPRVG